MKNYQGILIIALFLLASAGAMASPTITVDKNVNICGNGKCSNSTTIETGLQHIAAPLTIGIRTMRVADLPPQNTFGNTSRVRMTADGDITFYVQGINTTDYRGLVINTIKPYYDRMLKDQFAYNDAQHNRKYPLPSWAPRPGQCDLGVKQWNSRGEVVCTR